MLIGACSNNSSIEVEKLFSDLRLFFVRLKLAGHKSRLYETLKQCWFSVVVDGEPTVIQHSDNMPYLLARALVFISLFR